MDKNILLIDLKKKLKTRLQDNLKDLILFGSQTSDNFNTDSDYDILILLRDKPTWKKEREISDLCYEIDLKYGIITDTHILCEEDINSLRGKQPIFVNAINYGIHA